MDEAKLIALRLGLGRNMQRLRTERGLNQRQAAKRARMHWRHWHKLERGKANASFVSLAKVALALGCDVAVLFAPPLKQ